MLYITSSVFLLLGMLLLLAYVRSGCKTAWHRRLSAIMTTVSGILLLIFLGVIRPANIPKATIIRGCTAIVWENGEQRIEERCNR